MYGNEVTYDKRWDTEENLKLRDKLAKKYFHKSICYPDCPTGWAKEVLELLDYLESEFGIAHNTQTFMSYRIQEVGIKYITIDPFIFAAQSFYRNFIEPLFDKESYYQKNSLFQKINNVIDSFTHPLKYAFKAVRSKYYYRLLNKIRKPLVTLDQVKEKYGSLRIYFTAPPYLTEHIEEKIRETEIKLSLKGVYAIPVEEFYNYGTSWYCGNEYNPNMYKVKTMSDGDTEVTYYNYRQAMKNLGIDLKAIKQKVESNGKI